MRLYLIRHGQSTNNALMELGRYDSDREADPNLTEIGQQQAQSVAQWLSDRLDSAGQSAAPYGLTHLYCSPMRRALQTAQPIAQALGLPAALWRDIHEIGGIFLADEQDNVTGFPGMTRQEIEAEFPEMTLSDEIHDHGWWDTGMGRETPAHFVNRAIRVSMALRDRAHTEERIALVSHAAFLDALLKALLKQSPMHPEERFYLHYNTGVSRLDIDEGRGGDRIHYLNRVDHLPQEQRTW